MTITKRILIVDAEQFNIGALKIILKHEHGIPDNVVDSAKNGLEAVDIVKRDIERNNNKTCSYHLILMHC